MACALHRRQHDGAERGARDPNQDTCNVSASIRSDLPGSRWAPMLSMPQRTSVPIGVQPSLRDKVGFLESRDAYTPRPEDVQVIETHMSWVFLTDREVYKLKKPIRYDVLDFSTPELRRRSCEREIQLNRRLAPEVYLEVVALTAEAGGGLCLGGPGRPTDWLVKMKRLPAERMLDGLIVGGAVRRSDVEPAAALLAAFYRSAVPADIDGAGYRRHLREGIEADREELVKPIYRLPTGDVRRVANEQLTYVHEARDKLDLRVSAGRIVEGHGDLRPEHICLSDPPAIIDCLEFSRDLRILDPLDELSFLSLECRRLGAPEVGGWFLDAYRHATDDESPRDLFRFYRRFRALRRAKVAIWHLRESGVVNADKWRERAQWYIANAAHSAEV